MEPEHEKELIASVARVIDRDLAKLSEEISLFADEALLWKISGEIKNPAGNLCLHLCGNLQHYIGHVLGGISYRRNRDLEFSAKNVAKKDLLEEITRTRNAVSLALKKLDASALSKQYPEQVFQEPMTTLYFLLHLAAHLGYHLGQVNYHRRLVGAG